MLALLSRLWSAASRFADRFSRDKPEWHEVQIASFTGETWQQVRARLREVSMRTPYSVHTVASIELSRLRTHSPLTLSEAIDHVTRYRVQL